MKEWDGALFPGEAVCEPECDRIRELMRGVRLFEMEMKRVERGKAG